MTEVRDVTMSERVGATRAPEDTVPAVSLRGAALLRVIHQPSRLAQWHDTFWVAYQPASRYWLFQLVQGGVMVLLALILGALAVWLVRRRIA